MKKSNLFTTSSQKLLHFLFSRKEWQSQKGKNQLNELRLLYQSFSNLPLEEISFIDDISKSKVSNNKDIIISEFASDKINKEAVILNDKHSFVLNIKNINISINIFSKENEKLDTFVSIIKEYIQFIISLISDTTKNQIIINYYLLNINKNLHSKIPDEGNVNSGSCLNKNNQVSVINIWRKEEVFKVTIHELIHAFSFDNHGEDTEDIISHYTEKYNIVRGVINTNEAYTELWANLINCYLVSKKLGGDEETFYDLVLLEKLFCMFQCHKIIYHTKMDDKNKIDINKRTNVLSYYIIRSELYERLSEFLEYCRKYNTNYLHLENTKTWLVFLRKNTKINIESCCC